MRRGVLATTSALVACAAPAGGPPGNVVDAPPRDAPGPCTSRDLDLGGCQRADGAPCTGALGETRRFAELAEGGPLPVVSGPQGAAMFVFSVRTTGIVPGDPADPLAPTNPLVDIVVAREGVELAVYRGKVGFASDGNGRLVAAGLFVITEGSDLVGLSLRAHAAISDVEGSQRCGEIEFLATR